MPYSRGDVVEVPIAFTDQSGSKIRPALVISSDQYNQQTPDLLILSITGRLTGLSHPGDHVLADWQAAGLARPSKVQAKFATIESSIIRAVRGRVSAADLQAVERGIRQALDLTA